MRNVGSKLQAAGIKVIQADDGAYILTGLANTATGLDVLLLKADANGTEVWNRTFGGVEMR